MTWSFYIFLINLIQTYELYAEKSLVGKRDPVLDVADALDRIGDVYVGKAFRKLRKFQVIGTADAFQRIANVDVRKVSWKTRRFQAFVAVDTLGRFGVCCLHQADQHEDKPQCLGE